MLVIVGVIVVMGAVLGGFTMSGGTIGSLIHPSELLTIGGAALGALIVMSPKAVLVNLMKGVLQAVKGSRYGPQSYRDLFRLLYELLRLARRDGLMALEAHLSKPEESSIFAKYPRIADDHHVTEFICGALMPIIDGTTKPEQLPQLLEADINVVAHEHHGPLNVMQKTADSLPGFGIVAAVLGIVITMGAIDGPIHEIGHKVGTALVGTFLGILLCYGFFAPLASRMEFQGEEELGFFRTIATVIIAFVNNIPPKVAIEQARRSVASDMRPSREEVEEIFKEIEGN
ncbi:MAG: flagellar motor stator protein MotA [Pirellulales bacterium]|nr:flagellar motor stator protein MotA [Pirellulales bacterium]